MNKNLIKLSEIILLIINYVLIFAAGTLFISNIILSILCFIIAIYLQIIREKLQSGIRGDGIAKITVGDKEPINPAKGDLWIDTKQKQFLENSNKK